MTRISINSVFGMPSLVSSREMTSEERAQIPVLLIGRAVWQICFNQSDAKRGNVASSVWNFSARSSHVAKFRLFSQALFWTMDSPLIQISERPNYTGARKKTPLVTQLLHI